MLAKGSRFLGWCVLLYVVVVVAAKGSHKSSYNNLRQKWKVEHDISENPDNDMQLQSIELEDLHQKRKELFTEELDVNIDEAVDWNKKINRVTRSAHDGATEDHPFEDIETFDPETGEPVREWVIDVIKPQSCGTCEWQDCPDVNSLKAICPAGVVRDACDCCVQCASGLGMPCHLQGRSHRVVRLPPCGIDLECVHVPEDLFEDEPAPGPQGECVCTQRTPVCASNNVTYDNMCAFRSAQPRLKMVEKMDIAVVHDGPCLAEPQIDSGLTTMEAAVGDVISFKCIMSGYPVPSVKWFRRKHNRKRDEDFGESYKYLNTGQEEWELPGYAHNAVTQLRGGPGTYQITTWLVIDDVINTDGGKYICRATNEKGKVESSAILHIRRP